MNSKFKCWAESELNIIQNGGTLKEQCELLPHRTKESIRQMRYDVKRGKKPVNLKAIKHIPPLKGDELAYNGKPVKPYQPIKIAEATPQRLKEWGRLSLEEKRAMHFERERGYPM